MLPSEAVNGGGVGEEWATARSAVAQLAGYGVQTCPRIRVLTVSF